MRVHFDGAAAARRPSPTLLVRMLSNVTQKFEMESQLHSLARRPRVLLMVSQHGPATERPCCFAGTAASWTSTSPPSSPNHTTFADLAARWPGRAVPSPAARAWCQRRGQAHAGAGDTGDRGAGVRRPGGARALCRSSVARAVRRARGPRDATSTTASCRRFKGAKPYYQAHERRRGSQLIGAHRAPPRGGRPRRRPDHRAGRRARVGSTR